MESKALILGGHSGIGMAAAQLLHQKFPEIEQCVPEKMILDVRSRSETIACIQQEGPFTHIIYSAGVNKLSWIDNPRLGVIMNEMMTVNCYGFLDILTHHTHNFPGHEFSAVAVSSDAGRIPMRGSVAYGVSKAALNMVVKVAARELAPIVRVNAVAPGMVEDTAMTRYIDDNIPIFRGWTPDYAEEYERQGTPTGRRATKDEVAEAIVWLLTGPTQMTGVILDVNGGRL